MTKRITLSSPVSKTDWASWVDRSLRQIERWSHGDTEGVREKLTAATTFYTRTGGVDAPTRTGRANTDAAAFKTPGYAFQQIFEKYDLDGHQITVQHDGTALSDGFNIGWTFVGTVLSESGVFPQIIFDGGGATITRSASVSALLVSFIGPQELQIQNVTLVGGSNACLTIWNNAIVFIGENVVFGTGSTQLDVQDYGRLYCNDDYSVTGNANIHARATHYATCEIYYGVTFGNALTFGTLAYAEDRGRVRFADVTFAGDFAGLTAKKFDLHRGGKINTDQSPLDVSYLPGSAPGTSDGTGIYDGYILGSGGVTVSGLPSGVPAGTRDYVTDASGTTFNATVSGGGANKIGVIFDGTNWKIG